MSRPAGPGLVIHAEIDAEILPPPRPSPNRVRQGKMHIAFRANRIHMVACGHRSKRPHRGVRDNMNRGCHWGHGLREGKSATPPSPGSSRKEVVTGAPEEPGAHRRHRARWLFDHELQTIGPIWLRLCHWRLAPCTIWSTLFALRVPIGRGEGNCDY
jgi:hypothetical protein